MNLPKAIEILTPIIKDPYNFYTQDDKDAIKLGIEALKRIVYLRKDMDCDNWMTLPGETDD